MTALTPTAAAADRITGKMLRGKRWTRVGHGLYVPSAEVPADPDQLDKCRWLSAILPRHGAYSGLTAAMLDGWWLPLLPAGLPLFATVEPDGARPGRSGLRVRRAPLPDEDVVERHGLRLTSPMRTLLDLAEVLSLVDLVVVLDGALHRGALTLEYVRSMAMQTKNRRGIRGLRQATELAHPASQSAFESVLRLIHTLCEIPVEVQARIVDELGEFLADADLRIKGTRRLPEYDGASHRTKERHEDDLQREKILARAGFERYGYIAREILVSPQVIVQDGEQALGLRHEPLRVDGWLEEFQRSLFSKVGRARWARRWC